MLYSIHSCRKNILSYNGKPIVHIMIYSILSSIQIINVDINFPQPFRCKQCTMHIYMVIALIKHQKPHKLFFTTIANVFYHFKLTKLLWRIRYGIHVHTNTNSSTKYVYTELLASNSAMIQFLWVILLGQSCACMIVQADEASITFSDTQSQRFSS